MKYPVLLAMLAVGGVATGADAAQRAAPLVLAAASLQESMTAAADAWAAKGHVRPTISFAASSALARQVEAGDSGPVRVRGRGLDERAGKAPPDRPCVARDVPG